VLLALHVVLTAVLMPCSPRFSESSMGGASSFKEIIMANRNYNNSVNPLYRSAGSSAIIRAEFDSIDTGFTGVEAELDSLNLLKAPKASPTFTGTVVLPSTTTIGTVTAAEISYLGGVTSTIQTQINVLTTTKATIDSPTFTGTVTIPPGAIISGYALLASPAFTGVPTAPSAALGTGTDQLATCAFVVNTALSAQLPGQTGSAGKFIGTDGTNASWQAIFNPSIYQSLGGI
jgi:hypothetical protein